MQGLFQGLCWRFLGYGVGLHLIVFNFFGGWALFGLCRARHALFVNPFEC